MIGNAMSRPCFTRRPHTPKKEDGIEAASLDGDRKPRQVLLHGSNAAPFAQRPLARLYIGGIGLERGLWPGDGISPGGGQRLQFGPPQTIVSQWTILTVLS